jgi:pilus assembly protein Flp/PilA
MLKQIKKFLKEEDGVTAIEYGLIAGLVSIVIVAGLTTAGPALKDIFSQIGTTVDGAKTTVDANAKAAAGG